MITRITRALEFLPSHDHGAKQKNETNQRIESKNVPLKWFALVCKLLLLGNAIKLPFLLFIRQGQFVAHEMRKRVHCDAVD